LGIKNAEFWEQRIEQEKQQAPGSNGPGTRGAKIGP